MNESLGRLDPGAWVIDLGCGYGSFSYEDCPARIIALDRYVADAAQSRRRMATGRIHYLLGDAGQLPLASGTADLVISNHIFEHVDRPREVAVEISRVLKPSGLLFASIPDGFCFSDGLYRWWSGGGGHLQRFTFRSFQETVEGVTDLELLYAYRLYSSFSFLNPNPAAAGLFPPRSQSLKYLPHLAHVGVLSGINLFTRAADAGLGTRLSLYGWAFYFGKPGAVLESAPRDESINVCTICGAGHSLGWLQQRSKVRFRYGLPSYLCEVCGSRNPYFGQAFQRRILGGGLMETEAESPPLSPVIRQEAEGGAPAGPRINGDGLVDGASFGSGLAPGSLIAVFGTNFASETRAWSRRGEQWPLELGGVQLLVDGRPVPLSYVSPGQIVAHLPPDLPRGPASFAVFARDRMSPARQAALTLTAPAVFTVESTGKGRGVLRHGDNHHPVTPDNPARPGEWASLAATGLGPVVPRVSAGAPCPVGTLYQTTRRVSVMIAGRQAQVESCCLAPGLVGVYQVNVRVPHGLAAGEALVVLEIGGRRSNTVTLPVA